MPRRYHEVEHDNKERWVISYADFITLLFAFFVVMYSVSSVNEGKYRILSDSLEDVFTVDSKTLVPTEKGKKDVENVKQMDQLIAMPVPGDYAADREYEYGIEGLEKDIEPGDGIPQEGKSGEAVLPSKKGEESYQLTEEQAIEQLKSLQKNLESTFAKLIDDGTLAVTGNDDFIEIEIKNSILFKSGSADTNDDARFVIRKIAKMFETIGNPIKVEGFTDNVPIRNSKFPSNWELSSARAASIVRMMVASGIDPSRMAAVGYGEYQPIADNATVEGRKQNRRVSLIVSRSENIRSNTSDKSLQTKTNKGVFDPFTEMGESIRKATRKRPRTQSQAIEQPGDADRDQGIQLKDGLIVPKDGVAPYRLKDGELLFTADPTGRVDVVNQESIDEKTIDSIPQSTSVIPSTVEPPTSDVGNDEQDIKTQPIIIE